MLGQVFERRAASVFAAVSLLVLVGSPLEEARAIGRREAAPRLVRVLLASGVDSFELDAPTEYNVVDAATRRVVMGVGSGKTTVAVRAGQFWIGRYPLPQTEIRIVPSPRVEWLGANGVRYRGTLRVRRGAAGPEQLLLVNDVDVEAYLAGVIGREMPASWPMAALIAQAVAARSHALHAIRTQAARPYDLVANRSQAYGGLDAETPAARQAVEKSAGQVLYYQDRQIPGYFCATCGGHTEACRDVFPEDGAMPGSVRCDWCRAGAHYRWSLDRSAEELARELQAAGLVRGGAIRDVRVAGTTEAGRVRALTVETGEGAVSLTGSQLRQALGSDSLRSLWFRIDRAGTRFRFSGGGWGHGVGLCQNGAGAMAKAGAGARYILRYYYPGTDVRAAR